MLKPSPETIAKKVYKKTSKNRILESILADFLRFWWFLEVRLGSIFEQNMNFFGVQNFNEFLVYFWEGPAAGAGLIWVLKSEI